jgi:hypothetical protein
VVGSTLLAAVGANAVLASRLETPGEAVSDDDEVHRLVDDLNGLDVVSYRMAVDVFFPLMTPYQSVIGDGGARLGGDGESGIKSVIVCSNVAVVLLLVVDGLGTSIARIDVLARKDVWDGCCQRAKVGSSQL